MIKVTPMPDEPALAHEARRRRVVGARNRQEHFAWMRAELGVLGGVTDDATHLELLARSSGMKSESYAVEHSLMANFIVAAPAEGSHPYGSIAMAARTRQFGLQLPRKRAFVCQACIDEDMANEQFSWFRRAHQIGGADWCLKHRDGLHQVIAESPFERPPNWWREEGLVVEHSFKGAHSDANAFIDRIVSISMSLLRRERPAPCATLNQRLAEQARRLKVGGAKTKGQMLLSDRVLDLAGDDWLLRHFPQFILKTRGVVFREIDNVLKRRDTAAPGDMYVLALTALFDSAEAALHMVALADIDASTVGTLRGEI